MTVNSKQWPPIGGGDLQLPPIPKPPVPWKGFVDANASSSNVVCSSAAACDRKEANWLDTNLFVTKGNFVFIKAEGEAFYKFKNEQGEQDETAKIISKSGPSGHPYTCENLPTGFNCGALIARIGQGDPVFVGSGGSGEPLVANRSGNLQLAFEDLESSDNGGGYNVEAFVESGQ